MKIVATGKKGLWREAGTPKEVKWSDSFVDAGCWK